MISHEIWSSISASLPTWGANLRDQAHATYDPNETFVTPINKDSRNPVNNNIFTTNTMDHYTGLRSIMAKELQEYRQMISRVPGVVQPLREVSPTSHRISSFVAAIADTIVPKRFQTANMKPYDETIDPEEHVPQ